MHCENRTCHYRSDQSFETKRKERKRKRERKRKPGAKSTKNNSRRLNQLPLLFDQSAKNITVIITTENTA